MCDSVTDEDDESDSVTAEGDDVSADEDGPRDDVTAEGDDVTVADPEGV